MALLAIGLLPGCDQSAPTTPEPPPPPPPPPSDTTQVPAPVALVFSVEPESTSSEAPQRPLEVLALDAEGVLAESAAFAVRMRLVGPDASGAVLHGWIAQRMEGGRVVFDDLAVEGVGTDFQLVASAVGLDAATSREFDIGPWAGMPTEIVLESDPGDYIARGESYRYTNPNATIEVSSGQENIRVRIRGTESWDGDFSLPDPISEVRVGHFPNADRFRLTDSPSPGLNWSGQNRGCNDVGGWFAVDSVRYQRAVLSAIHLRFAQYCEEKPPGLYGTIHWDSADDPGM